MTQKTHFIPRNGEQIRFVVEGSGPPVFFGHGLTFSLGMWDDQARALRDRYTVVRIDFRGHGETRGGLKPFTLYDLADDVVAGLDYLGISSCVYVGFSMGGMVGVRLAQRYFQRLKGLVLIGTTAAAEPPQRRELYAQLNEKTRGKDPDPHTVEFVLSLMFSEDFRNRKPEVKERYYKELFRKNDDGMYHATRAVIEREDLDSILPQIQLPTLVIVSEGDMAVPPELGERLAAGIPGAELIRVPDSGHMVPVEKPEIINDALLRFLERVYP